MVGQQHVLKALINALDHNRLHHAYLFTGTRGVGKTTIARIFAKCLNCEVGVSSQPCGQCGSCLEIDQGSFLDLIEVDAASRTRVEDTRELMDNVQYAPSKGRFKVYLIDEVHMLSTHSFNALLKTLEEPPPHVKFLLATTDPQKLPVTVLSRCLQFNLKAMTADHISGHLSELLQKEMVPFEEPALKLIAKAADGSMRDALSLTDQAIAHGNEQLEVSGVSLMLGSIDQVYVIGLMNAFIEKDANRLLSEIEKLSQDAPDYKAVLTDLIGAFHQIAVGQVLGEAADCEYFEFTQKFSAEEVQFFYQTALLGRRDIGLAPDPRVGFEMILLRMMLFKPQDLIRLQNKVASSSNQPTQVSNQSSTQTGNQMGNQSPAQGPANNIADMRNALNGTGSSSHASAGNAQPSSVSEPARNPVGDIRAELEKKKTERRDLAKPAGLSEVKVAPRPVPGGTQTNVPNPGVRNLNSSVSSPQGSNGTSKGKNIVAAPLQANHKDASAVTLSENLAQFEYKQINDVWTQVVLKLGLDGAALSLVKNANFHRSESGDACLNLDPRFEMLATQQTRGKLLDALKLHFDTELQLMISFQVPEKPTPEQLFERMDMARKQCAKEKLLSDPRVGSILEQFNAQVISESVTLL